MINREWLGHSTCKTSQTITSGLGTARARLADNREWLGHSTCKTSRTIASGLGTARARLAKSAASPPKKNLTFLLKNSLWRIHTFVPIFQKIVLPMGILIFVGATLQSVQNIKPIRQLLCTDSSCSDLGIYLSYNIYNFHAI